MLHGDGASGTFSGAIESFVIASWCAVVELSGGSGDSNLGPAGNITTRGRQLEHDERKILCLGARFPLTEFLHLFTLRRQIRGIVIRRADDLAFLERRIVV